MRRLILFIFAFMFLLRIAEAQEVLTLEDCLRMTIENNLSLKGTRNEIVKGLHNIDENRARLMPQVNAVAAFNDNFDPPVSVTDGSAYGKEINVTKTLQYNASAGLQVQMPIYNQTAATSIEIARTMNQLNRLTYEKAKEDLIMQVSKMYYLAQNTVEQIGLIKGNISRLEALRDITLAFYDNGMAVEVDVQRVNFNLENLQVQYDNAQSMLTQQYNTLKYVMDYPAESVIAVVHANADEKPMTGSGGFSPDQYELLLLREKEKLAEQQKKIVKDGYLPTVSLSGNWTYSAYADKLKNWVHDTPFNHIYGSWGFGVSVRMPLFDGYEKRSKMRKAQVDIDNVKLLYQNQMRNMQTQYMNATNDLENSERNYRKQKDNLSLAQNVCNMTNERYKEGIASMTDVLQDEMRITEAQNNYLTAHYNYQLSNLNLLKLTRQLDKLVPSLYDEH